MASTRGISQGIVIGLLLLVSIAVASRGDRSRTYHECQAICRVKTCFSMSPSEYSKTRQSWPQRWLGWSCYDDCEYDCQQKLTDVALQGIKQRGLPKGRMTQFHGKWPFKRFMGLQEPFSVAFSLLNLWAHWSWRRPLFEASAALPAPLRTAYSWMPLVGVNSWVWSIVYHSRDFVWTERMDYFAAGLSTLYWLYQTILRLSGLYKPGLQNRTRRKTLTWTFVGVLLAHCSYLGLWKFDYSYNMAFNICIGLMHNLLWYIWYATVWHHSAPTPPHAKRQVIVLTLFAAATSFELHDFQPIGRAVDAHALWHLSTVPIIHLFYDFHTRDARYLAELQQQEHHQVHLEASTSPHDQQKAKQ